MDYLGWELARQQEALAALLLGGGPEEASARDRETRVYSREADAASGGGVRRELAAGTGGNRRDGPAADSAWEGVLRAWLAGRPAGRDLATASLEDFDRDGGAAPVPDGGTCVRRTAGENSPRWAIRRLPDETAEDRAAFSAGEWSVRSGRRDPADSGTAPEKRLNPGRSGGEESGGTSLSTAPEGPAEAFRRIGGGGMPEAFGLPVLQEAAETGGTVFGRDGGALAALRTEDGARALSRAVQRDARRYDGGFTIN